MLEYQLKVEKDDGLVRYLMKQDGANVVCAMPYANAMKIVKKGTPRVTEEFFDYPLTSDGVYYFDAMYRLTPDKTEGKK